jgi:methyl-accepting chemotaxis protein
MNRHSIQKRLMFLLLVPIVSLLYFGSSMVRERHREATNMRRAQQVTEVAVRGGQLLHHAQRERGLSAGFLGSHGDASFKAQLAAERQETDAAVAAFNAAVNEMGQEALGEEVARGYGAVSGAARELASHRSSVDGMHVAVSDVLAFYTGMNHQILAMVTDMFRGANASEIANRGTAYVSFMRAKESAGVERAVLSNAFGQGKFPPGMYAKLLTLIALQDDQVSTFHVYGGRPAWDQYQAALQGEFMDATHRMREAALASGGGALPGMDAKLWFTRQSEKIDAMAKVEAWLSGDIREAAADLAGQAQRAFILAALGMMLVVLVTMVLGGLVVRSVVGPLSRAVEVLGAVAGGDFTQELEVRGQDEVAKMAMSLNQAVAAIHQALGDVRDVSGTVATAAQQIFAATEVMASDAQKQAANLEETAATLEQITATVRQTSDNAVQASDLAQSSRETAERGGETMGQAVQAMGEINEASRRIEEITTAIDEIAFQTNLLALNAAVEAARAGEMGRGFAVVAAEVRNLAQRSASAAKEIKSLIQDSVRKVEIGTRLVNESGQKLGEIVASVKRVTEIVAEIAVASREQAAGIEQVNKAVSEMDQVTQGSAAQNEELSATAQGMAEQAQHLSSLVSQFQLSVEDQAQAERPREAQPPRTGPTPPARASKAGPAAEASSAAL